jgi:hypothetical protein
MADPTPTPGNPFEVRAQQLNNQNRKIAYYNGAKVDLAGIYPATNRLDGNLGALLNPLSNRSNNFFRQYITNYFLYDVVNNPIATPDGEDQRQRYSPFLWIGKDDPVATRREKWDLTSFNADYFARLKRLLDRAQERGIVVQLTLFDGAGMRFKDRWPYNPWNSVNNVNGVVNSQLSAMPDFYHGSIAAIDGSGSATTLGAIQSKFVEKVVSETLDHWNVVFEIMNEPTGGQPAGRAAWGDMIVGVINCLTKGRRLIFYNDHSQAQGFPGGGADVNAWHGLPNYDALDGVIFHGDPNNVFDTTEPQWNFTADKLIQASSDTHDAAQREQTGWNTTTTNHLFNRGVIYQAEASTNAAADGIKAANPTLITRAPFLGNWNKTSPDLPYFQLHFDASGRYFAFDPTGDVVFAQGQIVSFTAQQFVVKPDGRPPLTYNYMLSPDGKTLTQTAVANGRTQTFQRFIGDIEAFLYGWKKLPENPPTGVKPFFLYFHQDGSFVAHDLNDRHVVNQGRVVLIACDPPKISFSSTTLGTQIDYSYSFMNNGTRLRLTRLDNNHSQDFSRTFEGIPN